MNTLVSKWQQFKDWRKRRPFWGATLLLLSGLIILWIPIQLYEVAIVPGSILFAGFFFGGMVLLMAVMSYVMPKLSTIFGVIAIFTSVLSIMGALGGFLIGTILGIIGGALCIAWKPEFTAVDRASEENSQVADQEIATSIAE
ncbi:MULTISPECIES: DUF6114 domain-containing protein [unclassified Geobacillus]|uniref:DUF6114 domain-containing protein n=1 Tax=unclassified Geobacillus TaxID=2642459 RepID=UPI000BE238CA|nr:MULTISPECIES: DUF6114 domain-containing protein [unclassified Geobacillus]PDM39133.1 hypothetical protein CN643_00390 [Parageobacillus yumthangensis]RDV23762.1 hypothetical protein DXK91_00685 [Parageobacillus toebii]TXK90788.1 hypothetical protein FVE24_09645 [Parageobacillus sp. SY1]PUF87706.1 hypothetical protein DCC82_00395 [Geobacillus sp. LYN3]TXK86341.1 hypothetical protein FVE68_15030 [Geobacillus sp. AYS3]